MSAHLVSMGRQAVSQSHFSSRECHLPQKAQACPIAWGLATGSVQNPKCLRHVKYHGVCCQEAEGRTVRTHAEDNLSLWTLLQTNSVSRQLSN